MMRSLRSVLLILHIIWPDFLQSTGALSGGTPGILDKYAAVVIAGPEKEFSENDKFVLDQYIMNGGKVVWLIEEVNVNADSLVYGETAALYRPLNIEDQLFRYGARINAEVIQDIDCADIRLILSGGGERQQPVSVPWLYFPRLTPYPGHPITRNLNKVKGEFANYIDTVGLDKNIKKEYFTVNIILYKNSFPAFHDKPEGS